MQDPARGTSFALMQAVALRDLLRASETIDTIDQRYHEWTETTFEPWWQATVATNQAKLHRMRAAARGEQVPPDPGWVFQHAAFHDPELWRLGARIIAVLERPEVLLAPRIAPAVAGHPFDDLLRAMVAEQTAEEARGQPARRAGERRGARGSGRGSG